MSGQVEQLGAIIVPGQTSFGFDAQDQEPVVSAVHIPIVPPEQMTLRLNCVTAEQILEKFDSSMFSLVLARGIREVAGNFPDSLKLHSLRLWRPGAREDFVRNLAWFQKNSLHEAQECLIRGIALGQQQGKYTNLNAVDAIADPSQLEDESIIRDVEAIRALSSRDLDPEAIQQAPYEWTEFMSSIGSDRNSVALAIGTPTIGIWDYILDPRLFDDTMGDFRREHPAVIDLGETVFERLTLGQARKNGYAHDAFVAVAFGKRDFGVEERALDL